MSSLDKHRSIQEAIKKLKRDCDLEKITLDSDFDKLGDVVVYKTKEIDHLFFISYCEQTNNFILTHDIHHKIYGFNSCVEYFVELPNLTYRITNLIRYFDMKRKDN